MYQRKRYYDLSLSSLSFHTFFQQISYLAEQLHLFRLARIFMVEFFLEAETVRAMKD
jgi:hypothetical protein